MTGPATTMHVPAEWRHCRHQKTGACAKCCVMLNYAYHLARAEFQGFKQELAGLPEVQQALEKLAAERKAKAAEGEKCSSDTECPSPTPTEE